MGRFKSRSGKGGRPSKGMGRSIRHDAVEGPDGREPRSGPKPPEVHLRQMRAEQALARLASEVERHRRLGTGELLVIHGKGMRSEGGQPVLAPLVRDWIRDHPDLVGSWRAAPPDWGGEGALVIRLTKP